MKIISTILLFILGFWNVLGQEIRFSATAPKVVELNDQFRLTFKVNSQGRKFMPPDLSAFHYSGPSTSNSMNTSIVNGQVTQSIEQSYIYYLQPKKIGKFTIAAAQITVNGKTVSSNKVEIEVVKGANTSNNSNATNSNKNNKPNSSTSEPITTDTGKDLFIRILVNKTNAYIGEQLLATIKIYSRLDLAGFEDISFPTYNGFWTQEIKTSSNITLERENINGVVYNVGVLKRDILYPQRAGALTIEPATVKAVVRKRVRRPSFFDSGLRNVSVSLKSNKRSIKVSPLPTPKPIDFSGAVGTFKMTTTIDKNELKSNEPLNLKIKIVGNGNIKLIEKFDVKFPTDFEVYDPKISTNVNNSINGASGSKIFEYLVIPRHAGEFTIPPVSFSYFDIERKKYKTITSDEFKIKVEKGENDENTATVISGHNKEEVEFIGQDIRFIKTNKPEIQKIGGSFYEKSAFNLTYLVLIGLFAGSMLFFRQKIKENANTALMRNKKANKISQKRLKKAKEFMSQNKEDMFYTETLQALWGYLSDKLTIPQSTLSKENITEKLQNHQVSEDTINEFLSLIDKCEFAQYAPSAARNDMNLIYSEAMVVIGKIEQSLK